MKIPKNAELKFKGEIFDTYQWRQEMYDGSFETFEMLKRTNTVQILVIQEDKIILALQEQPTYPKPKYTLFGGRVDEGEKELDCAKRELLEEGGMETDDWKLFKVFEPYGKIEWEIYFYVARNCKKVAEQNLDAGEKIELKKFTFEQFMDLIVTDDFASRDIAFEILKIKEHGELEKFRNEIM